MRKLSSGMPPAKKSKMSAMGRVYSKDVSLAEAGKYGSLTEYAFFDKVTAWHARIMIPFYFRHYELMTI